MKRVSFPRLQELIHCKKLRKGVQNLLRFLGVVPFQGRNRETHGSFSYPPQPLLDPHLLISFPSARPRRGLKLLQLSGKVKVDHGVIVSQEGLQAVCRKKLGSDRHHPRGAKNPRTLTGHSLPFLNHGNGVLLYHTPTGDRKKGSPSLPIVKSGNPFGARGLKGEDLHGSGGRGRRRLFS